jgi:hypothetical protein
LARSFIAARSSALNPLEDLVVRTGAFVAFLTAAFFVVSAMALTVGTAGTHRFSIPDRSSFELDRWQSLT